MRDFTFLIENEHKSYSQYIDGVCMGMYIEYVIIVAISELIWYIYIYFHL